MSLCFTDCFVGSSPSIYIFAMAAKNKPMPIVFSHFDVPENVEGTFKARCKHCNTVISGSTKAISSFLVHIKVLIVIHFK